MNQSKRVRWEDQELDNLGGGYYVYVLEYKCKILYVGSGNKNRINHVLSGASHSKYLNYFYFFADLQYASVYKIYENLSKRDSLIIEHRKMREHNSLFNVTVPYLHVDRMTIIRAVMFDITNHHIHNVIEALYGDEENGIAPDYEEYDRLVRVTEWT